MSQTAMETAGVVVGSTGTLARRQKDMRWRAFWLVVLAVAVLGGVIEWLPGRATEGEAVAPPLVGQSPLASFEGLVSTPDHAGARRALAEEEGLADSQIQPDERAKSKDVLTVAARQITTKQYDAALMALNAEQQKLKSRPEAFVLIGRALEGKGDVVTARDFYAKAISMDPYYSEAYWGFATASESLGDLESALGAMRSFLHTDPRPDPKRLRIAQARSAIWEWESRLGRGPWGPTKGIMPGLKPEDQRKDNRGVAIMMPLPGSEKADGSAKFEIKHQSKFKLFEPDKP